MPTAIHVRSIIIVVIVVVIVVVVVVDDDTYYWVYLSSDYQFQVYYKVRQLFLLLSTMVCYYKVRQLFYYKVRQVLQSATIIKKCNSTPYLSNRQFCISFYNELGLFQTMNYVIC